jgi:hypothetical protein
MLFVHFMFVSFLFSVFHFITISVKSCVVCSEFRLVSCVPGNEKITYHNIEMIQTCNEQITYHNIEMIQTWNEQITYHNIEMIQPTIQQPCEMYMWSGGEQEKREDTKGVIRNRNVGHLVTAILYINIMIWLNIVFLWLWY